MKKTIYLLLFFVLLAASCNHDRISRGKFVKVLTEMYLYENEMSFLLAKKADSTHIYYSIFDKHKITKAQFDSTMNYYSLHPRQLKSVYEDVNKRLVTIKDKVDKEIAQAEIKSNLWKGTNKYTFKEEGKPKTVNFDVKVTEPGIYEVSATARYFPDDSTIAPHMSAYLASKNAADTIDLQRVDFTRDDNEKDYSMTFHIKDRNITHIKGYWLNVDDLEQKGMQHIQVHKLRIKKIDTPKDNAPQSKPGTDFMYDDPGYIRYLFDKEKCHVEDTIYIRWEEEMNNPIPVAGLETIEAAPQLMEQAAEPLQIQNIDAKTSRPSPLRRLRTADTARLR